MQMHLTSLKVALEGKEENCGAVGHIAHCQAVAGVCVQEGKGKRVKRINEDNCHTSARDNEGKHVCAVRESFPSRIPWLSMSGVV